MNYLKKLKIVLKIIKHNDVINTIRTTLRKALREYPDLKDNAEFKGYVHFANTSNIQTIFNN